MNFSEQHAVRPVFVFVLSAAADIERQIGDVKTLFKTIDTYRHGCAYFNRHLRVCVALRNMLRFPHELSVTPDDEVPASFLSDELDDMKSQEPPDLDDERSTCMIILCVLMG